jgi:hypothetical protein
MILKNGETEALAEIIYGDYKPVDGHMMPYSIQNKMNGQVQMRMTMDAIAINPTIDDALFSSPEKKDELKAEAKK